MWPQIVIFGAAVNFFGSIPYIIHTIQGRTKPNRVSWLLWSIAPFIGSAAAWSAGVTWAVLPVLMSGLMPLVTFLSSFVNPQAYWQLRRFDYLCGLFSVLALILWWLTDQPVVAILFAVISDCLAAIPTLVKSWRHPDTESGSTYVAAFINGLTAFAAIQIWTFSSYAFPIYIVIMNLLLFSAIYRRRIFSFFQK